MKTPKQVNVLHLGSGHRIRIAPPEKLRETNNALPKLKTGAKFPAHMRHLKSHGFK